MIYLITGSPGTGKTSKVVSMILDNYDGIFKYKAEDGTELDRPLYFCHIDGLDTVKFKAHELTEEQLQSAPLSEIVPTGSVVIVDEADYTYPVRSAAKEVPPFVKTLKELRHEGFTLILMTQHPTMIDIYVRNLVGKHIHLERKQVGTKQYEFLRCETNLSRSTLTSPDVVSSFYKPPKKAFKYYKSATMHVKFKKKIHWVFFALPAVIAFVLFFGIPFFGKVKNGGQVEKSVVSNVDSSASSVSNVDSSASSVSSVDSASISASSPAEFSEDFYKPRLEDKPETAPIYDQVRQVKAMEYPVACVESSDGCNCYSEQATLIKVSKKECRNIIKNGRFNPYKERDREERYRSPPVQSAGNQPSHVVSLGGQSPQNLMYDGYVEAGQQFAARGGVVGSAP